MMSMACQADLPVIAYPRRCQDNGLQRRQQHAAQPMQSSARRPAHKCPMARNARTAMGRRGPAPPRRVLAMQAIRRLRLGLPWLHLLPSCSAAADRRRAAGEKFARQCDAGSPQRLGG